MSAHELITGHLDLWTQAVTQKSTAGRGRNGKIELTGIKKLRELILELAVRGKLVEQDPNDEPASVLLEQVANEKAQLAKVGKIKKSKKLPDIDEEEKPFGLPDGWLWARMEAISEYIQRGKGPKYAETGGVRAVSQKCVQWSGFDLSVSRFVDDSSLDGYQDERYIRDGDVLWNSTGTGTVGRAIVIKKPQYSIVADSHVTIVRLLIAEPSYVLNYISSPSVQHRIEPGHENSLVSGTTKQVELNSGSVKRLPVPLPPLKEQHRIVQKVDELMALCDRLEQYTSDQLDAHETLVDTLLGTLAKSANATELADNWARLAEHFDTLFTTEQSIDKLKQTILQLGMMGLLTEPDHGLTSHPIPLEMLKAEVEAISRKERIKIPKVPAEVSDDLAPYKLPASWLWARVGEVIVLKHGYAFKSTYFLERESHFILTTPGNFYETGGFRDRGIKTKYYEGPVDDEFILTAHDLIIPMTEQAPGLLGSAAFVPENEKTYLHNQRLGKLVFSKNHFDPLFIYWFFNSKFLRDELARTCSGTTVRHTSPSKVAAAFIPVPDLLIQNEIALKIDELMAICDHLKQRLTQASNTRCQMAGAVVEGALEG